IQTQGGTQGFGTQQLQALKGGLALEQALGKAKAIQGVFVQVFSQQLARMSRAIRFTTPQTVALGLAWLESLFNPVNQTGRLAGVFLHEVADINVQRHATPLGPGMNGQMRLGQQQDAGYSAGLPLELGKCLPLLTHDRQPSINSLLAAKI